MTHQPFGRLTVMLNVPDVKTAMAWYADLGFEVLDTDERFQGPGHVNWAYLRHGDADLMLNAGGVAADDKPDQSLYIRVDDVDTLFAAVKDKATVIDPLKDQDYGMRDFWIRDLNGFRLGFGRAI